MQAKNFALHDIQLQYYPDLAWLLLVNINLPLLLFYRFHSGICLTSVWHVAYVPLYEKLPKSHTPHDGAQPLALSQSSQVMPGRSGGFGSQLLRSISYSNLIRTPSNTDFPQGVGGEMKRGGVGGSTGSLERWGTRGFGGMETLNEMTSDSYSDNSGHAVDM